MGSWGRHEEAVGLEDMVVCLIFPRAGGCESKLNGLRGVLCLFTESPIDKGWGFLDNVESV